MYLLTLHEDSNANVTLFHNSDIIFSVAEERLTRIKHKAGFPNESLKLILEKFNLSLKDMDIILCGNKYHPLSRIFGNNFPTFEHPFLGIEQKISLYYHHALFKNAMLRKIVENFNKTILKYKLGKDIPLTDHHTAHAYSAYMTSGFDKALAITTDNFGDGLSSAVFSCENGRCNFLYGSSALNSPGQFYGEISQILGFHPLMAGKMTGLAAYGNSDNAYNIVKDLFSLHDNKKDFVLPRLLFKSKSQRLFRKLRNYSEEDIAASAQKRFEEVMLGYIKEAVRITKISNIALAGGIYGNVRLNQKISELGEVKEIFIHPAMTDQGISLGVGLKYLAENMSLKPFKLKDVYWGPDYDNTEIDKVIKSENIPYEYDQDIEKTVAQLLSIGKVVARFSGRLEYGPRALGNRSILYQTNDKTVNNWLNKKLKRSEFMPFAPVTLEEQAHLCYKNFEKVKYNTKFMTISIDCTDWMKQISPGVVHVDGTARPQTIKEEDNSGYYRILKEYYNITGIPSLINTSFNMHEEPIINSPYEAIKAFKMAKLDYLAIGNYLIKNH